MANRYEMPNERNFPGFAKIKFRDIGIRVVYKPLLRDGIMTIIVVGIRSDSDAYIKADKRRKEYGL